MVTDTVFVPGMAHDAATSMPVASASFVKSPSPSASTPLSKSQVKVPCCPSLLGVLEALRRTVSPREITSPPSSVIKGVSGGANSNRTVRRSCSVPLPPPSGSSVLSTTRSNSSPSKAEGTCQVNACGETTDWRAPPWMNFTPTPPETYLSCMVLVCKYTSPTNVKSQTESATVVPASRRKSSLARRTSYAPGSTDSRSW